MTQEAKTPNRVIDILALAGAGAVNIAVANTDVAYSQSFILPKNVSFGLDYQFTSAGAVDVKVELEQGNERPGTEGSADSDWGVTDTISAGITDEVTHIVQVVPTVTRFGRLKLTGQGSNAASTVLSKAKLGISESA